MIVRLASAVALTTLMASAAACKREGATQQAAPAASSIDAATTPPPAPAEAQKPSGSSSWEDALAGCIPGSSFDVCVSRLKAAKVNVTVNNDAKESVATFGLQRPYGSVWVRTTPRSGGKIVTVGLWMLMDAGEPRKTLLEWFQRQIGTSAKSGRSVGSGEWAEGCGADGWGVGWIAPKSEVPEVILQLDSPQSESPNDPPERHKPEDALVKRAGNFTINICFLLPPSATGQEYVDSPAISPATMKAFLQSSHFHGKATLK
jgi:hypothetical protein